MYSAWPIIVGISLLGCKDKPPAKPAEQRAAAPAPSGATAGSAAVPAPSPPSTPSAPATSAPPIPRLDPTVAGAAFEAEAEDKDWAVNTERAIKAAVPDLTDIDCKQSQCRATLTATSEAELVTKADRLSEDDSLRGTNAKNVLLTAPTSANGTLSMKIYVTYDR